MEMEAKAVFVLCALALWCLQILRGVQGQPSTPGFACTANQSTYRCETYAFYRGLSPDLLDLAYIGDFFDASRVMIAKPSNISSPSARLVQDQSLFVPLSCSCNAVNSTYSISSSNHNYTFKSGDTFWYSSVHFYQNLTTYQAVELLNPTIDPTDIDVGTDVIFPVFCKCPNETQRRNGVNFLISYVFRSSDTISSVAARFRVSSQSIIDINGRNPNTSETIFIPVSKLPNLTQPAAAASPAPAPSVVVVSGGTERKGLIIGLSIGLGITGILSILMCGVVLCGGAVVKKRTVDQEKPYQSIASKDEKGLKDFEANLMADVSDCLDKYRLFKMEEIRAATDGFSESHLILGSVYKGSIHGQVYAIKKMKWDAREELKILQKVNHGNLVKLEGFCINPEDASCYLIYEYVENGSLHSWLHGERRLNWRSRVRIAVDVANGLQYIHEHTRPRVVHKDIKTSNILLDANMRAKIANFGLAKSGFNAITTHIVGTQGYVAPEYLADGVVSTKMDVFAFGVVLLELLSGREAVDEDGRALWATAAAVFGGATEEEKSERVRAWMDPAILEESFAMETVLNLMSIAVACVHRDPARRPTMVDAVYRLCKTDDWCSDASEDGFSSASLTAR